MDNLPTITDTAAPPKKRGRKPGGGKVPGSGRKPGTKNKVVADVREMILARGKPIELLCDISRGVKVRVGPQAGPGEPQYAYPTLQERAAAAKILLDKLVPAAPASLPAEQTPLPPEMSDDELADVLLHQLVRGALAESPPPYARKPTVIEQKPADPVAEQRVEQAAEIAAATAQPEGDTSLGGYAEAVAAQKAEDALARAERRPSRAAPIWVAPSGSAAEQGLSPRHRSPNVVRFKPR